MATRLPTGKRSAAQPPPAEAPIIKKTRRVISLALKEQFIKDVMAAREKDAKHSISSVARWPKYGFNRSEALRYFKDAEKICEKVQQVGSSNSKKISRVYPRKLEVLEQALLSASQYEAVNNIPVSDSRLKELAFLILHDMLPQLRPDMAPDPIQFSDGWLTNFKKNYGIYKCTAHGEEGDVGLELHGSRFKEITQQLSSFNPVDIYNCGETGLYLKVLSDRTLSDRQVEGKKIASDARVSILLCCNADGTDKRKPFILSRCRPAGLGREIETQLRCRFGNTGYMTQDLFKEWILELDNDMEGRQIALIMNNASDHENINELILRNITLVRLPLIATPVAQPLDAGIIRAFKTKYSRHMIRAISSYRGTAVSAKARVPNCNLWPCLISAWRDVSEASICNSFAHVPTIPKAMQQLLRTTAGDDRDNGMEGLKDELKALYSERAKSIELQKDFAMLAYLRSCEGKGPSEQIAKAIGLVKGDAKFSHFFLPPGSITMVDEDDLEDLDYADPSETDGINTGLSGVDILTNAHIMECRSSPYSMEPPNKHLSQESAP